MDALQLLTADHNRVRGLFTLFRAAHEQEDTERMVSLCGRIIDELMVHTTIEETVFYPRVKPASEEATESVAEGYEEHHVAKLIMAELTNELSDVEPGSEAWVAKVKVLIENIEHHAGEEETELFPETRANLDHDTLVQLGSALEAKKRELGAPTMKDNIDLTKTELAAMAREQQIPGRSKMDHDELAATVAPK